MDADTQHQDTSTAIIETKISSAAQMVEPISETIDAHVVEEQLLSKGKMIEGSSATQVATIAELRPNSYDKVLQVRVYRKWVSVSYGKKTQAGYPGKKTETAFCCILIDSQVCKKNVHFK